MKLTITREQLQEGLVAVAAAVPAKTTLPILSNILLEATKDGIRLSGTDLDIAVSTTVPASVDQEGAITLPARKLVEIVRELPSAAIRLTACGRAAGHDRVRPLEVPAARSATRGVPCLSGGQVRGRVEGAGERSPEADRPRGLRGEHRREPADPERCAVGAPARADADGGHQRPPARPDGRAHPAGGQLGPGRPDRAAQGAGADPPALRVGGGGRDRPEREPPRLPLRGAPRSSPGSSRGRTRTTSR